MKLILKTTKIKYNSLLKRLGQNTEKNIPKSFSKYTLNQTFKN